MTPRRMEYFVPVALALSLLSASTAVAQVRLAAPQQGIGIRVYAVPFELQLMTARESFEAVLDKPTMMGFGGGVEVLRLVGDLFVRGGVTFAQATGNRVVIVDDDVVPFDPPIDLKVTSMPIELAAGWRFTPRARPGRPAPSRIVPYVGGGLLLLRYRETTDFDEEGEGAFESFNGFTVFGGVEFPLAGAFVAAGEVQYRSVPDALGDGGVSAIFNETDLGGFAFRVLIGFRK